MTPLPEAFVRLPIAHRALHDRTAGRPENSLAAIEAACAAGYAIEIDVQPAADGVPVVFHDATLDRLTDQHGPVANHNANDLGQISLLGTDETIPTLTRVLDLVAGRVPLLVEVKDQGGPPQTGTAPLVEMTLNALTGYSGALALMSFNPFAVAHGAALRADLAWGVTTAHGSPLWPAHPDLDRQILQAPIDPRDYGGSFLSHGLHQRDAAWLSPLRRAGISVLAWTIRSPQDAQAALSYAQNITFEGYLPDLPPTGLDPEPVAPT